MFFSTEMVSYKDLLLQLPKLLAQAWDGYQCGYCGKEFRTQAELQCHQFSQHPH